MTLIKVLRTPPEQNEEPYCLREMLVGKVLPIIERPIRCGHYAVRMSDMVEHLFEFEKGSAAEFWIRDVFIPRHPLLFFQEDDCEII